MCWSSVAADMGLLHFGPIPKAKHSNPPGEVTRHIWAGSNDHLARLPTVGAPSCRKRAPRPCREPERSVGGHLRGRSKGGEAGPPRHHVEVRNKLIALVPVPQTHCECCSLRLRGGDGNAFVVANLMPGPPGEVNSNGSAFLPTARPRTPSSSRSFPLTQKIPVSSALAAPNTGVLGFSVPT